MLGSEPATATASASKPQQSSATCSVAQKTDIKSRLTWRNISNRIWEEQPDNPDRNISSQHPVVAEGAARPAEPPLLAGARCIFPAAVVCSLRRRPCRERLLRQRITAVADISDVTSVQGLSGINYCTFFRTTGLVVALVGLTGVPIDGPKISLSAKCPGPEPTRDHNSFRIPDADVGASEVGVTAGNLLQPLSTGMYQRAHAKAKLCSAAARAVHMTVAWEGEDYA